jgi:hypothetical protein
MPLEHGLFRSRYCWRVSFTVCIHLLNIKLTHCRLLFLISALVQFCLGRLHKKEKRYGPSPANGYTKGSGVKFFGRKNRKNRSAHDAEMAGAIPATGTSTLASAPYEYRPSHDTAYTGSTVAPTSATYDHTHKPMTGGYHTAPVGTYNASHTPATNY